MLFCLLPVSVSLRQMSQKYIDTQPCLTYDLLALPGLFQFTQYLFRLVIHMQMQQAASVLCQHFPEIDPAVCTVVIRLFKFADTFFHLKDSWELTENSQVMYMMELRKRLQTAEEEQKEQERKRNRLLYQADHDELTGLYNKRSLNRYLEDVFEDCLLNEKELGILFLDIDHFKQLNDRYGHGRGDEGICAVADTLKKCFPEDYVARYGGDEFLVVMTGRDREYAEEHARQLCMGIRECEIPNEDSSVEPWLTISVGGVCAIPKEPNRVWDFLSAADKTLYDQKNEQKGKVRFYVGEGQYL